MLVDERFAPGGEKAWKLDSRGGPLKSLTWPAGGRDAGLRFYSHGLDILGRDCPVGAGPFEIAADVEMTSGHAEPWPRFNGVAVALSSAPPAEMGEKDWAVLFAAIQQGVVACVTRGGTMLARRDERRPELWRLRGDDVSPRFKVTMGGAGGRGHSVEWPVQDVDGTRVRFHAWRDAGDVIRLTLYHGDGAAGPWWEAQLDLPEDLRRTALTHLAVHTTRTPDFYEDLTKPISPTAATHADGAMGGIVRSVRVRALGPQEKPALSQPLGTGTLPAKAKPAGYRSMYFPAAGGLDALRRKLDAPELADYKAVLLRGAAAPRAGGESLREATWAYVLTGQAEHRQAMLAALDARIGVTDTLPAERPGFPGRLRQDLDIREFKSHGVQEVAETYDLLGNDLDAPRRDRIRYLLVRAVRNYLDRIRRNDWWYVYNPSNTVGVGSGTMGLCALALRDDDPELCRRAVDTAVRTIATAYRAVRGDGSCVEGSMYWNYGMSYPCLLGYALRNATGTDRGLLSSPALRNAHRYMALNLGGDAQNVPFNDTQVWSMGWWLAAASGSEFDQPLMRWLADRMAREYVASGFPEQARGVYALLAFLFRDRTPAPAEFPGVPNVLSLDGVQEGVMRSDGGQFIPRLVTAVKGKGEVSTHHAQQDQGSFVLYANGEMLLLDPGYFEGGATSHSLPLIGEPDGEALDPRAVCPITDVWEKGPLRSMTVDATAAYAPGRARGQAARRARRVFVQVGEAATIVLDDTVPADGDARITAQYQAGFPAEVLPDGRAVVTGRCGTLTVATFGPPLKLAVTPREFSTQWVYFKKGIQWSTIRGSYAHDPARPLVTVLLPAAAGQAPAAATVAYAADRIDVTVGAEKVSFRRQAGGWAAVAP